MAVSEDDDLSWLDSFDVEAIRTFDEEDEEERKEFRFSEGVLESEELNKRLVAVEDGIRARGLKEFYDLRKRWSNWIIRWITALIIFNGVLALMVGFGSLNFADYKWFITAVTVETFLQIVGMGYVAVKFLFSEPSGGK